MKRRSFLQSSALGAAALTAIPITSCAGEPKSKAGLTGESDDFELNETGVDELQQKMKDGSYTAEKIVRLYLDRIEAVDKSGPSLNAIIEINPDAIEQAQQLDRERSEGKVRGPLHGIPVMIKDNIETGDKMMTTAGSLAMLGNIAKNDSPVAAQLRKAGAIIIAKTNLSEWANFRSSRSSSGWSSRGGQVRNPYILDHSPCGSSSGSGAAVSANLCTLAIGTETNGSITCPSNANGVVGIKPTVGLISRTGIIPISITQDTAGPMCRTVKDAAYLLGALTAEDTADRATMNRGQNVYNDYVQFLDADGLNGARIGVGRSYMGFHEAVDPVIEEALKVLQEKGAVLVDLDEAVGRLRGSDGYNVLLYEFKDGLNRYLATAGDNISVKTLEDIIRFNSEHEAEAMPFFKQEILEQAQAKGDLSTEEYTAALANMLKAYREDGIDRVMDENQLDAIVAPTGGLSWTIDLVNGDHGTGGSSTPAARAGYPNVTVPAGFAFDLPLGLSFFGRAYSEPKLLKYAYAFEQASMKRRKPGFLKSRTY
ncbi:MAG: amidase [Bacteroidia bacterium]|nr:MAG: amidase [Bacteroidia bacterium]